MNFWEILSDIGSDIERGNESTRGYGKFGRGTGGFILLIPHFLGALVGCAVARMFQMTADGYLHLGILFAFLGGVIKSTLMDRLSMMEGIVKNLIILAGYGLLIAIACFIRRN